MIIGPKYKIARRLGASVFEKTQTQKYAISLARKEKNKKRGRNKPKSEYGIQMLEKQKARFTYLILEKQFVKYVKEALSKKGGNAVETLYKILESRLDNIVLKAGFAKTRNAARQMVSHGHIMVNNKRVTIPSYRLNIGDIISIRPASANKAIFNDIDTLLKEVAVPSWIKIDPQKKEAVVQGVPKYEPHELLFDLNAVLEFYSR